MCGIVGYINQNNSDAGLGYILPLLEESSIRGLHGTGISFIKGDRVATLKEARPFNEVKPIIEKILALKPKALIAHVRYSTSNLDYPQPIASDSLAVVHNGVISQEPPETWEEAYGYTNYSTKNDSEILFKAIEAHDNPLEKLPEASIAACYLTTRYLGFFRNGKRPLWYALTDDYVIVSSTQDILERTGVKNSTKTEVGTLYAAYTEFFMEKVPYPQSVIGDEWQ